MIRAIQIFISCILLGSAASLSTPTNSRRAFFPAVAGGFTSAIFAAPSASQAIDINNAAAGDFTSLKGLFPTIAGKIVKRGPFKNAEEMYAAMDSDIERDRLKQYEAEFKFSKPSGGDRGTGKRSI